MYDYVLLGMNLFDFDAVWPCTKVIDSVLLWLTLYDRIQCFITLYDYVCLCNIQFRHCMNLYGPIGLQWLCWNQFRSHWVVFTLYDSIWLYLTLFDSVLLCLTLYCLVWHGLSVFDFSICLISLVQFYSALLTMHLWACVVFFLW